MGDHALYKIIGFILPVGDPEKPPHAPVLEYLDSPHRIAIRLKVNSVFYEFII